VASAWVLGVQDKAYDQGKPRYQSGITVKVDGAVLRQGTDYTVKTVNNTKVGTATLTVTGKGGYSGKRSVTFKVLPQATWVTSVKASSGVMTVAWKARDAAAAGGYQVQVATDKSFSKNVKSWSFAGAATSSGKGKLPSSGKCYVHVRSYKDVAGKRLYSTWSSVKEVPASASKLGAQALEL
jgi:hypothetical protein